MTLAPGRTWSWRGERDGRAIVEEWQSTIDALGARRVVGETAAVGLYADDRYVTVLDFDGAPDALLGLLYLGLPRAPYANGVTWTDGPASTPFVRPWTRLLHELALPFAVAGAVPTTSRLESAGAGVRAITELSGPAALPDRIEITCLPDHGPVQIEAWRDGQRRVWAEVAP